MALKYGSATRQDLSRLDPRRRANSILAVDSLGVDPARAYRASGGKAVNARTEAPGALSGAQARVGLKMIETIRFQTMERVRLAARLAEGIGLEIWCLPRRGGAATGAYFFILKSPDPARLSSRFLRRGIDTGLRVMRPCHALFGRGGEFPATEEAYGESIQVPLDPRLGVVGVDRVARAIREEFARAPRLLRLRSAHEGGLA